MAHLQHAAPPSCSVIRPSRAHGGRWGSRAPDQVLTLNPMLYPTHPSLLCQGLPSVPHCSQRQGRSLTHLLTHSFIQQALTPKARPWGPETRRCTLCPWETQSNAWSPFAPLSSHCLTYDYPPPCSPWELPQGLFYSAMFFFQEAWIPNSPSEPQPPHPQLPCSRVGAARGPVVPILPTPSAQPEPPSPRRQRMDQPSLATPAPDTGTFRRATSCLTPHSHRMMYYWCSCVFCFVFNQGNNFSICKSLQ